MGEIRRTLVVNLYGGPGTGKSLMMAHLFAALKREGILSEMSLEFAKEVIWQQATPKILNNQIYLFGVQHERIHRLLGQVDVVVTDAPLLANIVYDPDNNTDFHKLVLCEYHKMDNLNFLLRRVKKFEGSQGRVHDEHDVDELDVKTKSILNTYKIPYRTITAEEEWVEKVITLIKLKLEKVENPKNQSK